jgi:hypothetical protein
VSVQDIVLDDEENVENHREQAQSKLCGVAKYGDPVVIIIRVNNHLKHTQCASCKVEENISDAPTDRALPLVVHVGLRDVFDESDRELDVGTIVQKVQPVNHIRPRQDNTDEKKQTKNSQNPSGHERDSLIAPFVKKALCDSNYSGDGGMYSEHDVVDLNWIQASGVPARVLLLNLGNEVQPQIEDAVQGETDQIEGEKVEV